MKSLVIGSGFGGIAAALRLRAKGHDVTLVEKHKDLGGRARVFKKNGFIFDAGPTVITAPYLINELFELFNKKSENYINLKPLKTWYRFIFDDGSKFDYSGDEDLMKRQIEIVNKDDMKGYDELVKLFNGDEFIYKDLAIKSMKCTNSEFDDNPEIKAYIQVRDLNLDDNDKVYIFNGWMFSSSPSITPFDHPVYDIWLVSCY